MSTEVAIPKYPELDTIADRMCDEVCEQINAAVADVKSEMPYRAQYVLEELIRRLEKCV